MTTVIFNKPHYTKPCLAEAYNGKYSTGIPFHSIKIKFLKSKSSNYNKAVFLCSLFPEHELASSENGFVNYLYIDHEIDFYKYSDALFELRSLIAHWKYVEFSINDEFCYENEFYVYAWFFMQSNIFTGIQKINIKNEYRDYKNKWSTEKKLYHIIKELFPKNIVFNHYRAEWLEGLELDIFIEDLGIAIEYQGEQHFKPIEFFGGEKGFLKRIANDKKKQFICERNLVLLIYFTYQETITKACVKEKLSNYLKGLPIFDSKDPF